MKKFGNKTVCKKNDYNRLLRCVGTILQSESNFCDCLFTFLDDIALPKIGIIILNPLYTGRLFYCYMLDKSICHVRGVVSILSLLFYCWWKILLVNSVDPDQMPHCVASDLGLHCLPMTHV